MRNDTPRTDDQETYGRNRDWADFARKLEGELNTAVARAVMANGEIKRLNAHIRRLEEAGDKLCAATDKEWLTGTDLGVLCDEWYAAVSGSSATGLQPSASAS